MLCLLVAMFTTFSQVDARQRTLKTPNDVFLKILVDTNEH